MKIQEIRKRREKELGVNFDLGAFHRHVLTCIGPIEMLEECILEEEQLPFPKVTKPPTTSLMSTTEQTLCQCAKNRCSRVGPIISGLDSTPRAHRTAGEKAQTLPGC